MDQPLNLPAQTPSQFIAQLPQLAAELLSLSEEFETSLHLRQLRERMTETLRSWGPMEKLARESLIARGKASAPSTPPTEGIAEKIEKPFVPARRLAQSVHNRTRDTLSSAIGDPSVMAALIQWTQNKNSQS